MQPLDMNELAELSKSNIMCAVMYYQRGHSILELEAYDVDRKSSQYIIFEGVAYFEGATHWKGKRFYMAKSNACLEILRKFSFFDRMPDNYLEDKYKLFVIDGEKESIKIIALTGTLTKESYSGKGVVDN